MYDKERYSALRLWLQKWDFEMVPCMLINKEDRDIILMIMDKWEHEKEHKREYSRERKAQAFIKNPVGGINV